MRTFEYAGLDATGRSCHGFVEAENPKQARSSLAQDGILVERLGYTGRMVRLTRLQRANWYRALADLLNGGFPMLKAFDVLQEMPDFIPVRSRIIAVADLVREGVPLSAALVRGHMLDRLDEQTALKAAEQSGHLPRMLHELAGFLEQQESLQERVKSALLYPAVVLVAGIAVAVLQLGYLLPRTRMLLPSGQPLPTYTAWVMAIGSALRNWGWIGLVITVVAGTAAYRMVRQSSDLRLRLDRFWLDGWLTRRGVRLLVNTRFARTLGVLLHGGIPVEEAMTLAGQSTGNTWVGKKSEVAAQAVRQGLRLSESLRLIPGLSGLVVGYVAIGEASGSLAERLHAAADRCSSDWDRYVTRRLGLVAPLLILMVGIFVLGIAIAVLLPMLSVSQHLVP